MDQKLKGVATVSCGQTLGFKTGVGKPVGDVSVFMHSQWVSLMHTEPLVPLFVVRDDCLCLQRCNRKVKFAAAEGSERSTTSRNDDSDRTD